MPTKFRIFFSVRNKERGRKGVRERERDSVRVLLENGCAAIKKFNSRRWTFLGLISSLDITKVEICISF